MQRAAEMGCARSSLRFIACQRCGLIVQSGSEFIYLTCQPEDRGCKDVQEPECYLLLLSRGNAVERPLDGAAQARDRAKARRTKRIPHLLLKWSRRTLQRWQHR